MAGGGGGVEGSHYIPRNLKQTDDYTHSCETLKSSCRSQSVGGWENTCTCGRPGGQLYWCALLDAEARPPPAARPGFLLRPGGVLGLYLAKPPFDGHPLITRFQPQLTWEVLLQVSTVASTDRLPYMQPPPGHAHYKVSMQ